MTRHQHSFRDDGRARCSSFETRNSQLSTRRPGFSFAEVMFAVVILGIGFILVAAIFPVAIQQSQATGEESKAADAAREAANAIGSVATLLVNPAYSASPPKLLTPPGTFSVPSFPLFPPTVKNYVAGNMNNPQTGTTGASMSVAPPAIFVPFTGAQWEAIKGNTILASDPRIAYTAFYSRENGSSVMRIIVVAMTDRQRPVYNAAVDLAATSSTISATTVRAYPKPQGLTYPTMICNDQITFGGTTVSEGYSVATQTTSVVAQTTGAPAGRYYRVGRQIGGTTFELDPGNNMSLTSGTGGLWGTFGGYSDTQLLSTPVTAFAPSTLQATVAYAQITEVSDRVAGRIHLLTSPNSGGAAPPAAESGAFVIIADDYPFNPTQPSGGTYPLPLNVIPVQPPSLTPSAAPNSYTMGLVNGRVLRLGAAIHEDYELHDANFKPTVYPPGVFDLDPQYGMRPAPTTGGFFQESPDTVPCQYLLNSSQAYQSFYAKVYIIGMGKDDSGTYGKAAQDIGVYTTLVPVQ